jgi:hypothetical protein
MQRMVQVVSSFEAAHHWPDAPTHGGVVLNLYDTDFLKFPHRHRFGVKAVIGVNHGNRQIEFLHFRHNVLDKILGQWHLHPEPFTLSCEQFAERIFMALQADGYEVKAVEVSEDGENVGLVVAD